MFLQLKQQIVMKTPKRTQKFIEMGQIVQKRMRYNCAVVFYIGGNRLHVGWRVVWVIACGVKGGVSVSQEEILLLMRPEDTSLRKT